MADFSVFRIGVTRVPLPALRLWLFALALAANPLQAIAAAGLPADLVASALEVERLALQLDPSSTVTEGTVPIFIGAGIGDLQLLQVTFQLDADPPVRHTYSPAESAALQRGGLHQLTALRVSPGKHRFYIDYAARGISDRAGVPRSRSRLVEQVEVTAGTGAYIVEVRSGSLGREPKLELVQGSATVGLRPLDYLIESGRYFEAASRIIALRNQSGGALPSDLETRYATCVAGLRHVDDGLTQASSMLAKYESAVSALDAGQNVEAVPVLEQLAQQKADSAEAWLLRDQANTKLGYYFLDLGQPDLAATTFSRVRSPGPYGNTAMLGLGWAMLAPREKKQLHGLSPETVKTANAPDAKEQDRAGMPFASAWTVATDKQIEDVRRALVPWIELIGRDPTDAAVQEALLALPYALDHLGAHRQARDLMLRAIDQLENTRRHLDQALAHIASGEMSARIVESDSSANSGWSWWLEDLPEARWWLSDPPNAPANFYFERLTEDPDFRAHLSTAHQLHELGVAMAQRESLARSSGNAGLKASLDSVETKLIAAEVVERGALEAAATRFIKQIKAQTERYLVEAHFAIARLNDRGDGARAP